MAGRRRGRSRALALALLALLGGCAQLVGARTDQLQRTAPGSTTFHALKVGGRTRTFLLHRPPLAHAPRHVPLLIVLHGSGADANVIMDETHLNRLADSAGYAVAYPNGSGWLRYFMLTWNAGGCCGDAKAFGVDDVRFLRALARTLVSALDADSTRVYMAGFSDGGRMAYRMAFDDARFLAGVAVVSGALPDTLGAPAVPIAIDIFHGTADRVIPYGATEHPEPGAPPTTVPQTFAWWARRDGCRGAPLRSERGSVITERYVQCAGGAEVELHTIVGGQHAWPGGKRGWFLEPKPSTELDASASMLAFFGRHRRTPGVIGFEK